MQYSVADFFKGGGSRAYDRLIEIPIDVSQFRQLERRAGDERGVHQLHH